MKHKLRWAVSFLIVALLMPTVLTMIVDASARLRSSYGDEHGMDAYGFKLRHQLSQHWKWLCRKREKEQEKRQNEMAKAQAAQASSQVATHQQSMAPASPRASYQRPIKGDYSNQPLVGSYSIDNITTEIVISQGGATGASIVRDSSGMLSARLVFGSANDAKWWLYEGRYSSGLSFRTILSKAMSSGIGTFVPISW